MSDIDRTHTHRAVVILTSCVFAPAVVLSIAVLRGRLPVQVLLVLGFGYALLAGLVFYSAHSRRESASLAKAAQPGALFVGGAVDPAVRPMGVRLLVVDGRGLHLAKGRSGTNLAWTIPWSAVSSADLGEVTTRTGTSTGVVVSLIDGGVKTLGLPSRFGLSNDLHACQELVRTVNDRSGGAALDSTSG